MRGGINLKMKTLTSDLTLPPTTSPPSPKLDPSWEVVCACSFGQEWTWGYLQPDAERLLSTLSR